MTNPFLGLAPSTCLVGLRRSLARRVKDKNPSYHYTYPHTSDESQGVTLTVPPDHKLRAYCHTHPKCIATETSAPTTRQRSPQTRPLHQGRTVLTEGLSARPVQHVARPRGDAWADWIPIELSGPLHSRLRPLVALVAVVTVRS
jgi:hypothetical protein